MPWSLVQGCILTYEVSSEVSSVIGVCEQPYIPAVFKQTERQTAVTHTRTHAHTHTRTRTHPHTPTYLQTKTNTNTHTHIYIYIYQLLELLNLGRSSGVFGREREREMALDSNIYQVVVHVSDYVHFRHHVRVIISYIIHSLSLWFTISCFRYCSRSYYHFSQFLFSLINQ